MDKNAPKRMMYAIDLDGTLTKTIQWPGEPPPEPHTNRIKQTNKLFVTGHVIIIYTARRETMRAETEMWLEQHGVYHHALVMGQGKLPADCYVDDKCICPEAFFGDGECRCVKMYKERLKKNGK